MRRRCRSNFRGLGIGPAAHDLRHSACHMYRLRPHGLHSKWSIETYRAIPTAAARLPTAARVKLRLEPSPTRVHVRHPAGNIPMNGGYKLWTEMGKRSAQQLPPSNFLHASALA